MKIKHNTSFCSCLYEKQSLRRVCLWAFTEAFCYFVSVIAGQSRWSFPAEHCLLPSTRGTEASYGTSRDGSCTQKQCVSTGMLCSSRVSGTGSSVVALVTLVCLGFVLLVSQPQSLVLWVFRMRTFDLMEQEKLASTFSWDNSLPSFLQVFSEQLVLYVLSALLSWAQFPVSVVMRALMEPHIMIFT